MSRPCELWGVEAPNGLIIQSSVASSPCDAVVAYVEKNDSAVTARVRLYCKLEYDRYRANPVGREEPTYAEALKRGLERLGYKIVAVRAVRATNPRAEKLAALEEERP